MAVIYPRLMFDKVLASLSDADASKSQGCLQYLGAPSRPYARRVIEIMLVGLSLMHRLLGLFILYH